MPRVTTTDSDNQKKPAPRKRAVRPKVFTEAAPAPRPRRTAVTREAAAVSRRAPTTVSTNSTITAKKHSSSKAFFVVGTICVILVGTGIGIGMSDQGKIDIVATLNERNERINRGEVREDESSVVVPVASSPTTGRLRPSRQPVPDPVTTENSPSEDTDTTTELEAEGVVESDIVL